MKKLNKFFAVLVALAMMAMLSVTAFAADGDDDNVTTNPMSGTNIILSKELALAKGLTTSEDNVFKFTVTPVSYDGDTSVTANMPTISFTNIDLSGRTSETGAVYGDTQTNIASAFSPATVKPGLYIYTVSETNEHKDGITYDPGNYTIYVAKAQNGNITVTVKDDDATGTKVDAGKKEVRSGTIDQTAEVSGALFKNSYTKTANGTDPGEQADDHNASFYIKKNVDATYGDKDYPFPFTLTITGGTPTKIVKVKADADETVSLDNLTLKDGEILAVYGLPVGATYTVTENLNTTDGTLKKYTATVDVYENGTKTTKSIAYATDAEMKAAEGAPAPVQTALIGENANHADFLNTNQKAKDEDPGNTGILVSNLPYIALALVAIGGLVAYVVVRRKADDEA